MPRPHGELNGAMHKPWSKVRRIAELNGHDLPGKNPHFINGKITTVRSTCRNCGASVSMEYAGAGRGKDPHIKTDKTEYTRCGKEKFSMLIGQWLPLDLASEILSIPQQVLREWTGRLLSVRNGKHGYERSELYQFMLDNSDKGDKFAPAIKRLIRSGDPLLRLCSTCNDRPILQVDENGPRVCARCLRDQATKQKRLTTPEEMKKSEEVNKMPEEKTTTHVAPPPLPVPPSKSKHMNEVASQFTQVALLLTRILDRMDQLEARMDARDDAMAAAQPTPRHGADDMEFQERVQGEVNLAKETARKALNSTEDISVQVSTVRSRLRKLEEQLGVPQ